MFSFCLLLLSYLCIQVGTGLLALPEFGIVITTTKTVVIPSGVVLRVNESTPVECFRLVRRRPRRIDQNVQTV